MLELLVASGLLAVIMLGLLQMFYQTDRAFRLGVVQGDVLESGRSAMELITRDLQEVSAIDVPFTTNMNLWASIGYAGPQFTLASGEVRDNYLQPFFFLRRANGEWRGVRYDFVAADLAGGLGALYRMEISSPGPYIPFEDAEELSRFMDKNDAEGSLTAYGLVADGIVHLTIRAFNANGDLLYYDNLGNIFTNAWPTYLEAPTYQYAFKGRELPAAVEVELGVLEPKLALRARNIANATARRAFLRERAANVHVFRQRVPIRTTP